MRTHPLLQPALAGVMVTLLSTPTLAQPSTPPPSPPKPSASTTATLSVPGSANPWLAGMPHGHTARIGDRAPNHSPVSVPIKLSGGATLTFDSVTGKAGYEAGKSCGPDGCPIEICHDGEAENGIAGACFGTISGLVGVFLGDSRPDTNEAPDSPETFEPPAATDFRSGESREAAEIAPALKQVFFIGDGKQTTGRAQRFIVPPHATRLFLGTADGRSWNNNTGSFSVTVSAGCGGIDAQPKDVVTCPGGIAIYSVAATPTTPTNGDSVVRWQFAEPASDVWTTIADGAVKVGGRTRGKASNSRKQHLVIANLQPEAQAARFRATVTNSCGSFTTREATLRVCNGAPGCKILREFIAAYEIGDVKADVDADNDIDVDDLVAFFSTWDSGC